MDYESCKIKQIPKNLDECIKIDEISSQLRKWAKIINKIGQIYSAFVAFLSFIGFIITTAETEYLILGTLIGLICIPIVYILSYALFFALGLLLSALASITQNTCISANTALYNVAKAENGTKVETATESRQTTTTVL